MDRNPESRLILACLLRRSRDAEKIISGQNISLQKLSSLADKNLVRAALSEALIRFDLPPGYPHEFLRKVVMQNSLARDILLQNARWCNAILSEANVPMLLLKGLTLPAEPRRDINDLDILVPRHFLETAIAALSGGGYRYVGDELNSRVCENERGKFEQQAAWNNQFQFRHEQTGLIIELHVNLFQSDRIFPEVLDSYLGAVGELWNRKVLLDTVGIYAPGREDMFILMCVHGSVKRSPGRNRFALRTVLDLEGLAREGIDWPLVEQLSRRYGIGEHLLLGFRLVERYFPATIPPQTIRNIRRSLPLRLRFLSLLHFRCFRGIGPSRPIAAWVYRVVVPFFYPGSLKRRLTFSTAAFHAPLRHIALDRLAGMHRHD